MLNFNKYEVLTFDCYGTLINWEQGILKALTPVLVAHNINLSDRQILELFAELEKDEEQSEYITYKQVLKRVLQNFGERLDFEPLPSERNCIADSIKDWQPFPDTVEALNTLKRKYKLAIISNIDNDLFADSASHLKVEFDWVITAEQAKSYKPSFNNFELAIQRIGIARDKILHVAQSVYHDIIPASTLGLSTVWVNRRKSSEGFGATPPASKQADLEVPDLKTLVSTMSLTA